MFRNNYFMAGDSLAEFPIAFAPAITPDIRIFVYPTGCKSHPFSMKIVKRHNFNSDDMFPSETDKLLNTIPLPIDYREPSLLKAVESYASDHANGIFRERMEESIKAGEIKILRTTRGNRELIIHMVKGPKGSFAVAKEYSGPGSGMEELNKLPLNPDEITEYVENWSKGF